jgi:hypothetical protein
MASKLNKERGGDGMLQQLLYSKGSSQSKRMTEIARICSSGFTGCSRKQYTVRKTDLILRSIERRPQMQFSMARRFMLQLLRRYSVKFCKMHNFTLGAP